MKTIRISMEVWEMLKRLATPLEDTPDSVLRRVLRTVLENVPTSSRVIEPRANGFYKVPEPPEVPHNQSISSQPEMQKTNKQKGREKGERIRKDFVSHTLPSRGIFLNHIKGRIYKNSKGDTVAITFSSEQKPNRWFLGLPDRNYDFFIFLCEKDSKIIPFIIPRTFYKDINFSRHKRELRFHITFSDDDFKLDSPGRGKLSITKFKEYYECLK